MSTKTIDNLPKTASAAEMEAAIKADMQADSTEKEIAETEPIKNNDGQPKPAKSEVPPEAEATEEKADDGEVRQKAKSYDDLRPLVTRLAQDNAEIKRRLEQAAQMRQPEPAQPARQEATVEQWQEAYERDPLGTVKVLSDRIADSKVKGLQEQVQMLGMALGSIANKADADNFRANTIEYPGFVEMEPEIKEVLQEFPEAITNDPRYNKKLLKFGYDAVRGRKASEIAGKARESGRQEILAKKQAKAESHVEGSGKGISEKPLDLKTMSSKDIFAYAKAKGIAGDVVGP